MHHVYICESVSMCSRLVWTLHEPWQGYRLIDCSGIVPCRSHHAMAAVIADSGD
jgi:hypothetical protein